MLIIWLLYGMMCKNTSKIRKPFLDSVQYQEIIFALGREDGGFKLWADRGLSLIGDIFDSEDGNIKTFGELTDIYNVPRKHFYLHLRYFIGSIQKQVLNIPALSSESFNEETVYRGIISEVYNLLLSNSLESSESKFKAWKNDLQGELTTEEWCKACTFQTYVRERNIILLHLEVPKD